jgi:PPOX class probable F420-dependent enzyme
VEPRRSISTALEHETVIWLSSIRPDGAPHLVPLWFVWDGACIQARSKPDAQKVRNLRNDPRAMVAIGLPDGRFDVELFEANAVLPGATEVLPAGFASKYQGLAGEAGVTLGTFASVYSQPILLQPTRWIGWGGPGWRPECDAPFAGSV